MFWTMIMFKCLWLTSNPATPAWESIWRIIRTSRSMFCDWDCGEKLSCLKIENALKGPLDLPVDFEVAAVTVDRMKMTRPHLRTAKARCVSLQERWLCRRGVSPSKAFFRPMSSLLKRLIKSVISPKTPTNNYTDCHAGLSVPSSWHFSTEEPSNGFSSTLHCTLEFKR